MYFAEVAQRRARDNNLRLGARLARGAHRARRQRRAVAVARPAERLSDADQLRQRLPFGLIPGGRAFNLRASPCNVFGGSCCCRRCLAWSWRRQWPWLRVRAAASAGVVAFARAAARSRAAAQRRGCLGPGGGPNFIVFPGFGWGFSPFGLGGGGGCGFGGGLMMLGLLGVGALHARAAPWKRRRVAPPDTQGGYDDDEDDEGDVASQPGLRLQGAARSGPFGPRASSSGSSGSPPRGTPAARPGWPTCCSRPRSSCCGKKSRSATAASRRAGRCSLTNGETKLNALALAERSRFQVERVRGADGKVRRSSAASDRQRRRARVPDGHRPGRHAGRPRRARTSSPIARIWTPCLRELGGVPRGGVARPGGDLDAGRPGRRPDRVRAARLTYPHLRAALTRRRRGPQPCAPGCRALPGLTKEIPSVYAPLRGPLGLTSGEPPRIKSILPPPGVGGRRCYMHKLTIEDDEGKTVVVPLIRDEITVGRQEGNSIRLTERNISRRHARFFRQNGNALRRGPGQLQRHQGQRRAHRRGHRAQGRRLVIVGDYKLTVRADRPVATRLYGGGMPFSAGAWRSAAAPAHRCRDPLGPPSAGACARRPAVPRWRGLAAVAAAAAGDQPAPVPRSRAEQPLPSCGARARGHAGRRAHHPGAHAGRARAGRAGAARRRAWW